MAVISILAAVCVVIAATNGQQLWQDTKCRRQLQLFNECKSKMFVWKEQEEKLNATRAKFNQCLDKHSCIQQLSDVPHDLEWRKRKCGEDVSAIVKQKVVVCVRLRVSPDFELPESSPYAYGRYSYESIPIAAPPLESQCKRGDYDGAKKCMQTAANQTMMTSWERNAYFEKACARKDECAKLLDDDCLAQYDAYRRAFCECAFDVHELYGGKRLMLLVPSCAGLVDDKKTKYMPTYKERDSCALEDIDDREGLTRICDFGYEKYMEMQKQKMATTKAAPVLKVAAAPLHE